MTTPPTLSPANTPAVLMDGTAWAKARSALADGTFMTPTLLVALASARR